MSLNRARVLIVAENLQPPWGTGTVAYAKGLLQAVQALGSEVTILSTLRSHKYMARWMPEDRIRREWKRFEQDSQRIFKTIWLEEAEKNRLVSKLSVLRALRTLCKSASFDFIHVIFDGLEPLELSFAMGHSASTGSSRLFKHLLTPAVSLAKRKLGKIVSLNYRVPTKLSLACSSRFVRRSYDLPNHQKSVIIPPTIDTDFYRPIDESIEESCQSDLRVLYLGPVVPDRFPVAILDGMKIARREGAARVSIKIVTAPWRGSLEENFTQKIRHHASELGVANSLEVGAMSLTPIEKVKVFNSCDVAIQPFAGIPRSIVPVDPPIGMLETMSCGKPIIASRSMSIPKVILSEQNGVLLSDLSANEFAHSFILMKDKAEAMGKSARDMVLNRYSVHVARGNLENVYSGHL